MSGSSPGPAERNGAQLAVRNGRRLISSADLLAEHRRFDHAYSLAVIAFQEFGKAIILSSVADGLYSWKQGNKAQRGEAWYDNEGFYFDPQAPTSHDTKSEILGGLVSVFLPFLVMLEVRVEELRGRLNLERFAEVLTQMPETGPTRKTRMTREGRYAAKLWEAREEGRRFAASASKFESRRRDASYVDVRDGTLRKVRPFKATEYHELRDYVDDLDSVARLFVEQGASTELVQQVRDGWRNFDNKAEPGKFFGNILVSFIGSLRLRPTVPRSEEKS